MTLQRAVNQERSQSLVVSLKRMRHFAALTWSDQWLLLLTAIGLAGIRMALRFVPYRTLQHHLNRIAPAKQVGVAEVDLASQHLASIVSRASRVVPDATCLTQALVLQVLMARHGWESHVRIGVVKDEHGKILAHAWLESKNNILLGGADAPSRYESMTALERAAGR